MLRINCVPVGNAIQFTGIIHAFVWDNCHVLRVTSTHPPAQLTNASPVAQLHYSLLQLVIKSSCLKAFSHHRKFIFSVFIVLFLEYTNFYVLQQKQKYSNANLQKNGMCIKIKIICTVDYLPAALTREDVLLG